MSTRGKLIVTTFITLDGVMQAPGGPEEDTSDGFRHGGWLAPFGDAEMGAIIDQAFTHAEAFLLGRRTYQIFADYWPKVTDPADPVAGPLNRLPKYVASRTLREAKWHNSTVIGADLPARISELKRKHGEIQVHGSADLVQTLLAENLVDELQLWLFPVTLGTGKRLFDRGVIPTAFKLGESKVTSTGVVRNTYRNAGKPTYGTVGS